MRALPFFALAATAVLGGAGAYRAVVPSRAERQPSTRPIPKARVVRDPEIEALVITLHHRFSDRQNVDFGYARIVGEGERSHRGPAMDIELASDANEEVGAIYHKERVRKTARGREILTPSGGWLPFPKDRDQMYPESASELATYRSLVAKRRSIALYTFGLFDAQGVAIRENGPAFFGIYGEEPPEAKKLSGPARKAWMGGTFDLPGWRSRTETVFAEASCLSCHNGAATRWEWAHSAKLKVGDRLGMLVIAEKI